MTRITLLSGQAPEVPIAHYKPVDMHLSKLLPVKFSEQVLPGTFEYALDWLVDHEIDL